MPDARELLPELLNEVGSLLTDQVWFSSRAAAVAVTAWILHAAARDVDGALIWRASPRLLLTSRQNGSGKSTVLDLIALLLKSQAGRLVKVTPYGLTKLLNDYHDVGLPDDAQNIFGSTGEAAKELQSVLLGSYSRGGSWMSGKKNGALEKVYGPVAIAGKDKLLIQQAKALEDLLARSVIVRMERPPRYMPELDEDTEDRAMRLAEIIGGVMGSLQADLLTEARQISREMRGQVITDGDGGRIAQIGRPLLAIGRVAGPPWDEYVPLALQELMSAAGDLISADAALASLRGERARVAEAGGPVRNFWDHNDERGW
jgi:energy-coupling factor transporter ATP-binding protein EcfA2